MSYNPNPVSPIQIATEGQHWHWNVGHLTQILDIFNQG